MKNKKRIAILGIGGVGGYIGALLAWKYAGSDSIEILFLSREKTGALIERKGILLKTDKNEILAHPQEVYSDEKKAGVVDILIVCTKSYDLEESISNYKKIIDKNTLILPLQNGVESTEIIRKHVPDARILEGCIYLISSIESPGIIRQRGEIRSLHFGSSSLAEMELRELETILKEADIDAHYEKNIEAKIWRKFIFISVVGSVTCYFNRSVDNILKDVAKYKITIQLLDEIISLAIARGYSFEGDLKQETIDLMKKLPVGTTSSMQRDLQNGKKTEVEALTGHVIRMGLSAGINLPTYTKVYQKLKK